MPETGAVIFEASTASQEAGTRSEYPVPVCLIRPALSTASVQTEEEFPKQETRINGINSKREKRKKEFICYQKGI
ncbi:hypothetical protein H6768_03940 [Candidatus Peribacteria bacterium]|nr:hypothetical protein [Candidatus Peribacteria bacterium]